MTRGSAEMSSIYDEDFFTWTQDQAVALRRLGERGDIDVAHLAEEIEDLGKRDLREVSSFLQLFFYHLMKIAGEPQSASVAHWRTEAREFRLSAVRAFTPGMRQLIGLPAMWSDAETRLNEERRDIGLPPWPTMAHPFHLSDCLSDSFDLNHALGAMGRQDLHRPERV